MADEEFLSYLKDKNTAVTIFLVNGVKLQGYIADFAPSSVFLEREGYVQLIYKHAISTIMPGDKIRFEDIS